MDPIEKPADWFDRLPATCEAHPERVNGFTGVMRFTITGDDGGTWTVTFEDGAAVVEEGETKDAAFTVKMKDRNFVKMMNGELGGPEAFMGGKLKFRGDVAKAIKLRGLLFA